MAKATVKKAAKKSASASKARPSVGPKPKIVTPDHEELYPIESGSDALLVDVEGNEIGLLAIQYFILQHDGTHHLFDSFTDAYNHVSRLGPGQGYEAVSGHNLKRIVFAL